MPDFEPIAIIGQACTLPEANSPTELWQLSLNKQDCLSTFSEDYWRPLLKHAHLGRLATELKVMRGGCLRNFSAYFDPTGFALAPQDIMPLDVMFQIALHTARAALHAAHYRITDLAGLRVGAIFGNLSYPVKLFSEFAELTWLTQAGAHYFSNDSLRQIKQALPDARNAYMAGLPAQLLAQAFQLTQASYTIDAACASSLYAIKLACDQLQQNRADMMLTGAVNVVEHAFLHTGFAALQALSPNGQSRPFQNEANGLVPSVGAGFLVLKRLDAAMQAQDPIIAVIRGVGLANDGNQGGALLPNQTQQVRAMQQAYQQSGLKPQDIDYIECHATGTPHGDPIELASMRTVFSQVQQLPIAALKSNLGHLLGVSGVAAIIRAVMAMQQGLLPPTVYTQNPMPALATQQFRLLGEAQAWPMRTRVRRVAVSCFGFGGNNAHLLLESWQAPVHSASPALQSENKHKLANNVAAAVEDIAIVGIGVYAGNCKELSSFTQQVLQGHSNLQTQSDGSKNARLDSITLAADKIHFPPADLQAAFAEQLSVLALTHELVTALRQPLNPANTAVFAGMQCNPNSVRWSLRAKLQGFLSQYQTANGAAFPVLDATWMAQAEAAIADKLTAADALGCMPNMLANRINQQFDFCAPSFSVSSEELSGIDALMIAVHALQQHEIDTAIVAAADMCCEPVRIAAMRALLPAQHHIPCDGAVVFILQRLSMALAAQEKIYAILPATAPLTTQVTWGNAAETEHYDLTPLCGYPHCAVGLMHVAAAALSAYYRQLPGWALQQARPWLPDQHGQRSAKIAITALGGRQQELYLQASKINAEVITLREQAIPRYYVYSANNQQALIEALNKRGRRHAFPALQHPLATQLTPAVPSAATLTLVAHNDAELQAKISAAQVQLTTSDAKIWDTVQGIYYLPEPLKGELAFVFPGASLSYSGMGRDLLLALPELLDRLQQYFYVDPELLALIYQASSLEKLDGFADLKTYSALCQLHAIFSRDYLGLQPNACIGMSSGESNALFAMQAWHDNAAMYQDIVAAGIYSEHLAGNFSCAVDRDNKTVRWQNWWLQAPVAAVQSALATESNVYLTIIQSPQDCIIGGEAQACQRVLASLGQSRAQMLKLPFICHCPPLEKIAPSWRAIHQRPTVALDHVRFYSGVDGSHYTAESDIVADALLRQALQTVDFPRVINQAWDDGVRVFLEHGPRGLCSHWINDILGDKPHVAIAYDQRPRSALLQAVHAIAQLVAAGITIKPNHFQG